MDEEILQKAVLEQGPQDEAGLIAKAEGIDFNEVLKLCLQYKSETKKT